MGVIYSGNFYRPDEQPKRRGSHAVPADQDPLRWMPAFFLAVGVVLGLFLLGLGAWVANVIAEVAR